MCHDLYACLREPDEWLRHVQSRFAILKSVGYRTALVFLNTVQSPAFSSACEHDTYSTLRTALDVEAGEYLDILISPSQTNICDNACAHFHNHITRKPRRSPSHPHPSTRSIPLLRHHLRCLDIGSSATDISRRITTGTTRSSHSMPHRRHNLHLLLHLHLPTHKRR